MPRDYLSHTPLLRAMGFGVSTFLSLSRLGEHAKWRCDNPPTERASQQYLRDTTWKQGNLLRYPLCDTMSKRFLRDMGGGILHWAAKEVMYIVQRQRVQVTTSCSVGRYLWPESAGVTGIYGASCVAYYLLMLLMIN